MGFLMDGTLQDTYEQVQRDLNRSLPRDSASGSPPDKLLLK